VPERLVSADQKDRIAQLNRFRFTHEQFMQLKDTADRQGVLFLSTPFDLDSARFLESLVPAFKIASGDIDFFPLLQTVALTGKPVMLSSGLATLDEIQRAVTCIRDVWQRECIDQELAVLHCVASYPTPPDEANLRCIETLRQPGVTVGYSDHTLGIEAPVLAVALGARIIEKHFTLDKNYSEFRDHHISADPEEMADLVRRVRTAAAMLGDGKKEPQPCERASLHTIRRSIVAGRPLSRGHCICLDDLSWTRPQKGMKAGQENLIVGKRLTADLAEGDLILPENFA
jgi:N-acetylneuraminate synthase/N,N'-diacetyllegionaminate synthase